MAEYYLAEGGLRASPQRSNTTSSTMIHTAHITSRACVCNTVLVQAPDPLPPSASCLSAKDGVWGTEQQWRLCYDRGYPTPCDLRVQA